MNYPYAFLQFAFFALSDLIMDFLGLFIVAIAIPFRVPALSIEDGRPILNLPWWAYPWGNDFDGLLGDKRGWWASNTPFGVSVSSYLAMYWWTAIRNPANNMRMFALWNCPIVNSVITYKGDRSVSDNLHLPGFQFVKLVSFKGHSYYGLYYVHAWSVSRYFVLRLGFKISPDLDMNSLPKGETTRLNPFRKV